MPDIHSAVHMIILKIKKSRDLLLTNGLQRAVD